MHSILPSSFSTKRSSSTPCKSWLVSYWVVGQFTTCCCSQSVSHMHFGHLALPVKSPPALAGMQSSSMIQGLSISRFYHIAWLVVKFWTPHSNSGSLYQNQILNPIQTPSFQELQPTYSLRIFHYTKLPLDRPNIGSTTSNFSFWHLGVESPKTFFIIMWDPGPSNGHWNLLTWRIVPFLSTSRSARRPFLFSLPSWPPLTWKWSTSPMYCEPNFKSKNVQK